MNIELHSAVCQAKIQQELPWKLFCLLQVFRNQNTENLKHPPKNGKRKLLVKHLVIEGMQVIHMDG